MLSIGDERDAVDTLADRDFVLRQHFVADDADSGGGHAEIELGWNLPAGELLDRFDGAGNGTGDDYQHDEDASQIFGAIVAVGVAMVGGSAREDESDPEGNGGEHVAAVVQCVGEETCAAADDGNAKLE